MAHIALAASARRWHKVVQPVSKAGRLCKDAATKDNKPRSRGLAYHRSALPLPAATVFRRGDPVARPMPPLPERLLVCPAPPKRVAGQRPGPPAPPAWPVDCGNQRRAPPDGEGVQRPARAASPAPDDHKRHKRRDEAAHRPAHPAPPATAAHHLAPVSPRAAAEVEGQAVGAHLPRQLSQRSQPIVRRPRPPSYHSAEGESHRRQGVGATIDAPSASAVLRQRRRSLPAPPGGAIAAAPLKRRRAQWRQAASLQLDKGARRVSP